MPEFQTFLNPENMDKLWNNVEWLLFYIAPIVMIYVAITTIGYLIDVIKKAFKSENKNDEQEEYDIYRF